MLWLRTFDQTTLQLQLQPQSALFAGHLAIIALMIEPRQMQNAVQHQNLHFVSHRMTQAPRILPSDVSGNCNVASNTLSLSARHRRRWKREYVRGLVCSTELPVKRLQL